MTEPARVLKICRHDKRLHMPTRLAHFLPRPALLPPWPTTLKFVGGAGRSTTSVALKPVSPNVESLEAEPLWSKPTPGLPLVKVVSIALVITTPFWYNVILLPMTVARSVEPFVEMNWLPVTLAKGVKSPNAPFHLTMER